MLGRRDIEGVDLIAYRSRWLTLLMGQMFLRKGSKFEVGERGEYESWAPEQAPRRGARRYIHAPPEWYHCRILALADFLPSFAFLGS